MPRIIIMAGGTGGHVFPGLAVAHELVKRQWQVSWFGTQEKMEAEIVPRHGFDIHFLKIAGVRGKGITRKIITPFTLLKAVVSARKVLKTLRPDVVLGMGGYASGPGGIAAYTMGIPIVLHEQNAVFGLTNRVLSKFANVVLSGFDTKQDLAKSKAPKDTVLVGNPIREGFNHIPVHNPSASNSDNSHTLATSKPLNVLVIGGSLGALVLNDLLPALLCEQHKKTPLQVRHQTGKGKSDDVEKAYISCLETNSLDNDISASSFTVIEFIDDMEAAYAWADILICRAGALTVAEVAAAGRAAIFVPLPIAVDDHQTANAESLSKHEAAIVIQQNELQKILPATLAKLCSEHSYRLSIANKAKILSFPNATQKVADHCENLIGLQHKQREKRDTEVESDNR